MRIIRARLLASVLVFSLVLLLGLTHWVGG
jgi:hypothetical protein